MKDFTIHQFGVDAFMWEAPDGRLYLVPADGNLIRIDQEPDPLIGGYDLSNTPPPRHVTHITRPAPDPGAEAMLARRGTGVMVVRA